MYHAETRLDVKDRILLDWDRVKWSAPVDMVVKVYTKGVELLQSLSNC